MKQLLCQWTLVVVLCLWGADAAVAGGMDARQKTYLKKTSQIIVSLNDYRGDPAEFGISEDQLKGMENAAGISLHRFRKMSGRARVLSLPGEISLKQLRPIIRKLKKLSYIRQVEPDKKMQILGITPNDPLYADQWHYHDATGGINLPEAWEKTTGSPDVVVAVLDTGILGDHEDLSHRWDGGYDFITSRFNARDRSPRDAIPKDEGDWTRRDDSSWHGSHVAGTIGAATDNGIGVAGIDWQCKIMPVRVLGRLGGFTSDIVDAMRWAAGLSVPDVPDNPNPAHVINMSLGGSGVCSRVWQEAVDDVTDAGTIIVVAAGNSGDQASEETPGSCDSVITVAASNRKGELAYYSNYGERVDISAPGGETANGVLYTLNTGTQRAEDDTYVYYQGTSMAAPHVAGVVALMHAINPDLTFEEVVTALKESARPFPVGTECAADPGRCGAGILDANAALEAVGP